MDTLKWIKPDPRLFIENQDESRYSETDGQSEDTAPFNLATLDRVHHFHSSIDTYEKTPLHDLSNLAEYLGLDHLWIKDESSRMGLSSFKILGGSYVVCQTVRRLLSDRPQKSLDRFSDFAKNRTGLAHLAFVTATDGNHGRGIAWTAARLGYPAFIFMPAKSSPARVENIRRLGATVVVTEQNYDDTVREAASFAAEQGYEMVQDTICEGCFEPPLWIMQGYLTIAQELIGQLGEDWPTHVFLQAGVGAFAGAIAGFFHQYRMKRPMPSIIVLEADQSACYYESIVQGKRTHIAGDLSTIMAGLACGETSPIGWKVLSRTATLFVVCHNEIAARGMRVLGNPLPGDPQIIAGESGAVGLGLVSMAGVSNPDLRQVLGLNHQSKVLAFNTEGDTDPDMYRDIVWDGLFPSVDRAEANVHAITT